MTLSRLLLRSNFLKATDCRHDAVPAFVFSNYVSFSKCPVSRMDLMISVKFHADVLAVLSRGSL